MLTSKEELAIFRAALARSGGSNEVRYALAAQLYQANAFDELTEHLRDWNVEEYRFLILQAESLLSRQNAVADGEARDSCLRALELSALPSQRAFVLSVLGKIYTRLGELDEARSCLGRSLAIDANDKDAYKRVVALDLKEQAADKVLSHADRMLAGGIAHARVLCSQTLALTQLGMFAEAREAQAIDRFLSRLEPEPPSGWDTLEAFNAALAEEIGNHPDVRYERYGAASAHSWRIDEPGLKRLRVVADLQAMIAREVKAYVAALAQSGHPFASKRPTQARLRNWCVIAEGDGHETWHVHQNGWLSGVYYIHVQDHIAQGTGREGCIAFGIPEELVGTQAAEAFGEVVCRPRTGLMMLFPSHIYHRTYPHHGSGRRICFAFDIVPEE